MSPKNKHGNWIVYSCPNPFAVILFCGTQKEISFLLSSQTGAEDTAELLHKPSWDSVLDLILMHSMWLLKNHNYSTKTASCVSLLNSIQQSLCSGNKNNMSLKWGIVCKWWFGKQCCWHSLIQAQWSIFSIIKHVTAAESDAQNYTMLYNHFKLQRNFSGCVSGHLQKFELI